MSGYPPGFSGAAESASKDYYCPNVDCQGLVWRIWTRHPGWMKALFRRAVVRGDCDTRDCGQPEEWTVHGYNELGGWFPEDDDSIYCPTCGAEGKQTL